MTSKIEWTDELVSRFWSYVDKTNNCWNWTAGTFTSGYGQFRVGKKKMRAHRVSWLIAGNNIPDGMILCHHCDNVKCVRPAHVFVGTHKDNAVDREIKNRGAGNRFSKIRLPGTLNPAAKLNEEQVKEIRSIFSKGGVTKTSISKRYSISLSQVVNIILRRSWVNV